jgi:hypothetical protein
LVKTILGDSCGVEPLWGNRFHCLQCPDLDLCEACYDNKGELVETAPNHTETHNWEIFEVYQKELCLVMFFQLPEKAGGFPVHNYRCRGCQVFPIIGYCFACMECTKMKLCKEYQTILHCPGEQCFRLQKEPKEHKKYHSFRLIVEPEDHKKGHKWFGNIFSI